MFTNSDRLVFNQLYRWFPSVLKVVTMIRPEPLSFRYTPGAGSRQLRPSLIAAILKLSMHFPLGPPPQSSCLKGGHCHGPRQPAEALRLALSGPPADAG
jgi:hypothetical protein